MTYPLCSLNLDCRVRSAVYKVLRLAINRCVYNYCVSVDVDVDLTHFTVWMKGHMGAGQLLL